MTQPTHDAERLPHLAEVFDLLRRGRHVCAFDGAPYRALAAHEEEFTSLFAALGFQLQAHPRGFYHFRTSQARPSEAASRMALFVFVLVEWLAGRGREIEPSLMNDPFDLDDLPHLASERHARIMREAGVADADDLDRVVAQLERFGFAARSGRSFRFRPPAYRFLDLALEVLAADEDDEDVERDEDAEREEGDE
jgi:hypothetical protein